MTISEVVPVGQKMDKWVVNHLNQIGSKAAKRDLSFLLVFKLKDHVTQLRAYYSLLSVCYVKYDDGVFL